MNDLSKQDIYEGWADPSGQKDQFEEQLYGPGAKEVEKTSAKKKEGKFELGDRKEAEKYAAALDKIRREKIKTFKEVVCI